MKEIVLLLLSIFIFSSCKNKEPSVLFTIEGSSQEQIMYVGQIQFHKTEKIFTKSEWIKNFEKFEGKVLNSEFWFPTNKNSDYPVSYSSKTQSKLVMFGEKKERYKVETSYSHRDNLTIYTIKYIIKK